MPNPSPDQHPQGQGEILIYEPTAGDFRMEVRLVEETLWLSLNQMAELFGVYKSGISRHLKNIFETGELQRNSVVANFATTAADGKTYQVEYYNLDAIISVGYRVNSLRGTQFRIWATQRLREYLIKGFAIDDKRLKNGAPPHEAIPYFWNNLFQKWPPQNRNSLLQI